MRFMIMVKATKDSEAGKFPPEKEKMFEAMTAYHEDCKKPERCSMRPACRRAGASSTWAESAP